MLDSLKLKLNSINYIYEEIYEYLKMKTDIESHILKLNHDFLNDDFGLEEHYHENIKNINVQLKNVKKIFESVMIDNLDEKTEFIVSFSLLKYIYHYIQSEIFLYNTILNKVLFEQKFEKIYSIVYKKFKISKLSLLQIIEDNTKNKYTNSKVIYESTQDKILALDCVRNFIIDFSLQKKYEKEYNIINNELFTPLLTNIRTKLHEILENNKLMPINESEKYCIWKLIPYIENVKMKMGFYD